MTFLTFFFTSLSLVSLVCNFAPSKFTFLFLFVSLCCDFFHSNFQFSVFFHLLCYFLSPKFTFSVFFTLCCDFLSPKLTFYVFVTLACLELSQVNIGMTPLISFWTRSLPWQPSVDNTWPIKLLWNGWPNDNGGNTTIPRIAWSALNHSRQQMKKVCDLNHLSDEYWGPVDNARNLIDHFQTIFSLISKLFTLDKLMFNSALRCWIFLISH